MPAPAPAVVIDRACAFSHYLSRLLHARPEEGQALAARLAHPFDRAEMESFADWPALTQPDALMPALRRLRQAVMARIIARDVGGLAGLDEVVTTVSLLAEFAVERALVASRESLSAFGQPIGADSGQPQALIVVGMGKLGGGELNVSSDIDLIFIYPEAGETDGERRLSNHEYFCRQGKEIIRLINDVTADGQVFRVDMRLRPYGDSGPLAMSFAAFENYLLSQGREWERYAWIKAKSLSGDAEGLAELVRPFVYRKYLDYNAYGAMRELHAQIRREVARRDMSDNIKLGPGGIREVEFIAQVFQLIRGGRERSLQLRGTRATLRRLAALRLMEPTAVNELLDAYVFLRNLEHRLQYLDDQQTQTLPQGADAQAKVAASMGCADWQALLDELNRHRRHVARHFEQVFFLPTESAPSHPFTTLWHDIADVDVGATLAELGFENPAAVQQQLRTLAASTRYQQMPQGTRKKFDALIGPLLEVCGTQPRPDATLARVLGLMEAISRRAAYLALLTEYPQTLQRLAALYSASSWVAGYLTQHPILLDELLDARVLYASPDWPQLAEELETRLAACEGDVEAKMDALRHFKHSQTFRLVAQDLAGMWTLEALSDELSQLADLILAAALRHAWQDVPGRHCDAPRFAIVGYGKLGGKELGYASDLDLIFLYDDPHPDAQELYARLARRLTTWLTSTTSAGVLYDIDLRLRPDGQSGLMVGSVASFAQYQHDKAWVWEHQALTRARFVAGDAAIGQRFEAIRSQVLRTQRDDTALRAEVVAMRERMRQSHPPRDDNVKHAEGGIVDVEFIVQYLILAHAHALPALTANSGNIALLRVAADAGLIAPTLAQQAQEGYRLYRRLQHASRLDDSQHTEPDITLLAYYQSVRQLWQDVLG